MNLELARKVRERAAESCEYCRIPHFSLPLPFQIDHIIAGQHHGDPTSHSLVRIAIGIRGCKPKPRKFHKPRNFNNLIDIDML